ncbi:hypothetical protein HDU96_010481, partial [Phlyctochytrium bullatum]
RQLAHKDLDKLAWALDAMTLSQYFSQRNAFDLAYECLTCSEHMLSLLESAKTADSGDSDDEDPVRRARADVAWIWGKFYLLLLTISAERLDRDMETPVGATSDAAPPSFKIFTSLKAVPSRPYTPVNFARTYDEAKVLFLEGISCLTAAKQFFTLDGFVSDHVLLVQDMSQTYHKFSLFEPNPDRKLKLQRRRIEFLNTLLLSRLSPHHFAHLVQQVTYELATVYENVRDIAADLVKTALAAGEAAKAGTMAVEAETALEEALRLYDGFLKMFGRKGTGAGEVEKFQDPDDARTFMTAKIRKAWLLSQKLQEPLGIGKEEKAKVLASSIKEYVHILEYHQQHKIPDFEDEIAVVKQMVQLLRAQVATVLK